MIACLEILVVLLFLVWFFKKGNDFIEKSSWKTLANVKTNRVLVNNKQFYYSHKEVVEIYMHYQLSRRDCYKFLISKGMQSSTSTILVNFEELSDALKGQHIPLNQVNGKKLYTFISFADI